MKKPVSIMLLLLVFAVLFSVFYLKKINLEESSEAVLVKAFDYSGAKALNSEIYFWGRLDNKYASLDQLKILADNFASELGILKDHSFSRNESTNDFVEKIEQSGKTIDNKTVNVNVQINKENKNITERFVSVTINQDSVSLELHKVKEQVSAVLKRHGVQPKVNTCITGIYDGKLDYNQLNEMGKRILEGVEAKKVEGIRDNNVISVSAYSPGIEDYIKIDGRKINLNLAIRFNSYENKTYIWLATPIITTEY